MIYNAYACTILALGVFFGMFFYTGHMLIHQPWYLQYRDYAVTAAGFAATFAVLFVTSAVVTATLHKALASIAVVVMGGRPASLARGTAMRKGAR